MSGQIVRRSGGRPTAEAAILLEAAILEKATAAFLRDGYAATTIDAIARAGSVAKRTIYARWSGKPAIFRSVLAHLMSKWLSASGEWPDGGGLMDALRQAADQILAVALTAEAVALHRLLIAESGRFPELPVMLQEAGATAGVMRLSALLDGAVQRGEIEAHDTSYAAEQFMHLLLAGPQRRALGLGVRLSPEETSAWRDAAIALFLGGVGSLRLLPPMEK